MLLTAPLLVPSRIPAPSLHPWTVLAISSTRRGAPLLCPDVTDFSKFFYPSGNLPIDVDFNGGKTSWMLSLRRTICRRNSRHHYEALWLDHSCGFSKRIHYWDTTTRSLSCQIPLHVRTLQACVRKSSAHTPNEASGGKETVIFAKSSCC